MMRIACVSVVGLVAFAAGAGAQWNPAAGQWGRTDPRDVRVMTWNVRDAICSTNGKAEGANNWCAAARIIASMKPDVLILQECGDNSGNGTGGSADSAPTLTATVGLLINGGMDPVGGLPVGSYVRKYDASLSYPYIYVSGNTDGFNRNVIVSKYPFADLNGDSKWAYDIFTNLSDLYAPGGGPGIRGWTLAEIDLPGASYRGDLVIGNSHLKSGGAASDLAERLQAAKNIAYFIDYWYNGGGGSAPDPRSRIADFPQATRILDPYTPVIWGGDCNEDERNNGRDGPVLWMTRAESVDDGTDRDRTDSSYDDARDPLNTSASNRNTQGSGKLDYQCWQDSIATQRRAFIYVSASGGAAAYPPEMIGYPTVALASSTASDHRPVIADYILAAPVAAPGAFGLLAPASGAAGLTTSPLFDWSDSSDAASYTLTVDDDADFSSPAITQVVAVSGYQAAPGALLAGRTYFWKVVASGLGGSTASTPVSQAFSTQVAAPGAFDLLTPPAGSTAQPTTLTLTWSDSSGAESYRVTIADNQAMTNPIAESVVAATSLAVESGVLSTCGQYWWTVRAENAGGTADASSGPWNFATLVPVDFNGDGFVDFFDYDDFVLCYEGQACPEGRDADFNGDSFVDFFDYDDFVVMYENGC